MKNVMKRFLAVLLVIVLIGGNLSTAALADDWDWSYEGFSEDDWYDDGWSESYDYYTSSAQEQANTTYDYSEYDHDAPEASSIDMDIELEAEDEIDTANAEGKASIKVVIYLNGEQKWESTVTGVEGETVSIMGDAALNKYFEKYENDNLGYSYSSGTATITGGASHFFGGGTTYNAGDSAYIPVVLSGTGSTLTIHRYAYPREGINKYTLTYEGGECAGKSGLQLPNPATQTRTIGKSAQNADSSYTFKNLGSASCPGYNFTGWKATGDVVGSLGTDEVNCAPGGEVTLIAQWAAHAVTGITVTADPDTIVLGAENYDPADVTFTATVTGVANTHFTLYDADGTVLGTGTIPSENVVTFHKYFSSVNDAAHGDVTARWDGGSTSCTGTWNIKKIVPPTNVANDLIKVTVKCVNKDNKHPELLEKTYGLGTADYTLSSIYYDEARQCFTTTLTVSAGSAINAFTNEFSGIKHYAEDTTPKTFNLVSSGTEWVLANGSDNAVEFTVKCVYDPEILYMGRDGSVLRQFTVPSGDGHTVLDAADAGLELAVNEKLSYWYVEGNETRQYVPGSQLISPNESGARVVLLPKIEEINTYTDYPEASVTIENWFYGDTAKAPVCSGPATSRGSDHYTTDPEITYSDASGNAVDVPVNAGAYTVKATWKADDKSMSDVVRTASFNIIPRPITLVSDPQEHMYNGETFSAGIRIEGSGLVNGEEIVVNPYTATHVSDEAPAQFTVDWAKSTAEESNYSVTSNVGAIVITPRHVTFTSRSVDMWWDDGREMNNASKMNVTDPDYEMNGDAAATGVTIGGDDLAACDSVNFSFHRGRSLLGVSRNEFDYVISGACKDGDYVVQCVFGLLTVSLYNDNGGAQGGGTGTVQPSVTPEPGTEPSTPPSTENSPEPSEQPSVTPEPGTEPSTPPSTENSPEPSTEPDEPDEPDVPVEPTIRPVAPTPPQNGGDVALPSDADFGNDYDPNSPELEEPAAPAEPVTPAEPETPAAPEAPEAPVAPVAPEDNTPAAPAGPTEINPDDTPLDDVPQIPGANDNAPSATPRPAATPAPTASPAPAAPVDDDPDDDGAEPDGEVTIDEDETPLADLPEVDGEAAEPELTIDEEVLIDEDETPLANFTDCCALHFVLMLLALAVAVYYTYDRKKRQAREFEVRSEL